MVQRKCLRLNRQKAELEMAEVKMLRFALGVTSLEMTLEKRGEDGLGMC